MLAKLLAVSFLGCALAGCGNDDAEAPLHGTPGHIRERTVVVDFYRSIQECIDAGRLSRRRCVSAEKAAMEKHPRFAEKFGQFEVCEDIYGAGACTNYGTDRSGFSSPRPVGFLVCNQEPDGCEKVVFAPIYRNQEWGEFTGNGGGFISPSPSKPGRFILGGVVQRPPVI